MKIRCVFFVMGVWQMRIEMKSVIALSAATLLLLSVPAHAQWLKVPPAKVPRTADGKPNLSAPAPRLPDGKPDLSGIWEPANNRYVQNIAADLKPEDVPYQPWARALKTFREKTNSKDDPEVFCVPAGGPRATSTPSRRAGTRTVRRSISTTNRG